MQLFDAAMHEPASETRWDAARAEEVADRIASDTAAAWERDGLGLHPQPAPQTRELDYSFWTGAAGILWALERLGHGVGEAGLLAQYQAHGDAAESPGLMHGEVGVLLVSWKLEPTPAKEDRLLDLVVGERPQPVARAVQRLAGDDAGCPPPLRADGR